jgi:hypothetical protein
MDNVKAEEFKYVLKLSNRKGTKGVMFCLYLQNVMYSRENQKYYMSYHFLKNLGTDFDIAYKKAVDFIKPEDKSQILVLDREAFNKHGGNNHVLVTGKYRGKTISQIHEIDSGYVYWIAQDHPTVFEKHIEECIEYCIKDKKTYKPVFHLFTMTIPEWKFIEMKEVDYFKIHGIAKYFYYYEKDGQQIIVRWYDKHFNEYQKYPVSLRPVICVPNKDGQYVNHYESLE